MPVGPTHPSTLATRHSALATSAMEPDNDRSPSCNTLAQLDAGSTIVIECPQVLHKDGSDPHHTQGKYRAIVVSIGECSETGVLQREAKLRVSNAPMLGSLQCYDKVTGKPLQQVPPAYPKLFDLLETARGSEELDTLLSSDRYAKFGSFNAAESNLAWVTGAGAEKLLTADDLARGTQKRKVPWDSEATRGHGAKHEAPQDKKRKVHGVSREKREPANRAAAALPVTSASGAAAAGPVTPVQPASGAAAALPVTSASGAAAAGPVTPVQPASSSATAGPVFNINIQGQGHDVDVRRIINAATNRGKVIWQPSEEAFKTAAADLHPDAGKALAELKRGVPLSAEQLLHDAGVASNSLVGQFFTGSRGMQHITAFKKAGLHELPVETLMTMTEGDVCRSIKASFLTNSRTAGDPLHASTVEGNVSGLRSVFTHLIGRSMAPETKLHTVVALALDRDQRLEAGNPIGEGFARILQSQVKSETTLKQATPVRTLQTPGKWLLHWCHDFACLLRELTGVSNTAIDRLHNCKLMALHRAGMALLSQLLNMRCTTRPSDPCLLDISCCKLLIGTQSIPTAAVAMYGLQRDSSCHVNLLLNSSSATLLDVARGKVRSAKANNEPEIYWTQLRELAMPAALSMLSLGHVIVFIQMLDMIITATLHARLLNKVAPTAEKGGLPAAMRFGLPRHTPSGLPSLPAQQGPSSSSSSSMPNAAAVAGSSSGGGGSSGGGSISMVPICKPLTTDDVNGNKSMLYLEKDDEGGYTATCMRRSSIKKGGGSSIAAAREQASGVLATSKMGTEQEVRSSTQKDAFQSGMSTEFMAQAFQHGEEMQRSYCNVKLEQRANGSNIELPTGNFSQVSKIPVRLKDSDTLEGGVQRDMWVLSHIVNDDSPALDQAVSGVLQSKLFADCKTAIQMVVAATPGNQRVLRLYEAQKDTSKVSELMPAFDIPSVDGQFHTSTLCIAAASGSKPFSELLARLPTLCCSGVCINDQQLAHEGFASVFSQLQQECGKLSSSMYTGDDAAPPVAGSTSAVLIQSYTPWLFGKMGQHYINKCVPPPTQACVPANLSAVVADFLLTNAADFERFVQSRKAPGQ
ncbi:hypothetical protein OEZ85_011089 [Tetradesmus obliquus]|uniref:Uncharacterized protein n=1 Tax=Tetradesmus obliquus TaxID=3088 RepID=A0ABY8TPW6_TETOB|nr:hypothetical protein OEZ85_011089 [Tetradesmus obliquus]